MIGVPHCPGIIALEEEETKSQDELDYDPAGNLVNDTYTSYGRIDGIPTRLYDAENRLTTAKDGNLQVVSSYLYNADGQRTRRTVNGVETWQVYGMDGGVDSACCSVAAQ